MKDNARKLCLKLATPIKLAGFIIAAHEARADIPHAGCQDRLNILIGQPNLVVCASCHGGQSPLQAPKWMASANAVFITWNGKLDSNTSAEENIFVAKAQNPQTPHGGGKAFPETTIATLRSEISDLMTAGCLPVHDISGESNLSKPSVPFYTNLRKRFVALVGEDSAAVSEISQYALQLGRADFRVAQNSRFTLNPATASIIERVVVKGCQELTVQKGWAALPEKKWLNSFANFIASTVGLPLGNAYSEATLLNQHFSRYSAEQKALLSCSIVLRSERFLLL